MPHEKMLIFSTYFIILSKRIPSTNSKTD